MGIGNIWKDFVGFVDNRMWSIIRNPDVCSCRDFIVSDEYFAPVHVTLVHNRNAVSSWSMHEPCTSVVWEKSARRKNETRRDWSLDGVGCPNSDALARCSLALCSSLTYRGHLGAIIVSSLQLLYNAWPTRFLRISEASEIRVRRRLQHAQLFLETLSKSMYPHRDEEQREKSREFASFSCTKIFSKILDMQNWNRSGAIYRRWMIVQNAINFRFVLEPLKRLSKVKNLRISIGFSKKKKILQKHKTRKNRKVDPDRWDSRGFFKQIGIEILTEELFGKRDCPREILGRKNASDKGETLFMGYLITKTTRETGEWEVGWGNNGAVSMPSILLLVTYIYIYTCIHSYIWIYVFKSHWSFYRAEGIVSLSLSLSLSRSCVR